VVSREIREHRGSPFGPPPRVGTEVLEGGAPLAVFCVVIVLLAAFPSGPVHAAEAERKPVPDKVIRDEARKFLGQIVELKPQSRSEAQAGAQRLLEKAQEVKAGSDDRLGAAAVQYVLLDKARELAELGGDAGLAVKAIDRLGELFVLDVYKSKYECLKKLLQVSQDKSDSTEITYLCLDLSDDRILADDYDRAKDFAALAVAAAKGIQQKGFEVIVTRQVRDVAALSGGFKRLSGSFLKLKGTPGDFKANAEVGEFYCFSKECWKHGLPFLARGDNLRRADLARAELEGTADSRKKIQLVEKWMQLAKEENKKNQNSIFRHTLDLLRSASTSADALTRVRIDALEKEIPVDGDLKLRVTVAIDGSDDLHISDLDLLWVHKQWQWPRNVRLNDQAWQPKSSSSRPLPRKLDGTRFDFTNATVVKKKGRGEVNQKVEGHALIVSFVDNPNGEATYEAEIIIPRKGYCPRDP